MRISTIIANCLQIIIVLAIFLTQGLALGAMAVLGLFVLMLIAVVNLIYQFNGPQRRRLKPVKRSTEKSAITKRQTARVTYAFGPRPVFDIGKRRFDLLDLSEGGFRFRISRHAKLNKRIKGRISLLHGQQISVKGQLARREGEEAAVKLNQPIAYPLILEEKRMANPAGR